MTAARIRPRRSAFTAALVATVVLGAGMAHGEAAHAADPSPFAGVAPVETATLAGTRGGMRIGSFDFDIGVAVRTALDEKLDFSSKFEAIGGKLTRTAVSAPAEAVADGVAAGVSKLPSGVSELPSGGVAWDAADGLTVLHDPAGLGSATVFNQLDNQAIRHRVEVNIRVTNFRERIDAFRAGQAVGNALRDVTRGSR